MRWADSRPCLFRPLAAAELRRQALLLEHIDFETYIARLGVATKLPLDGLAAIVEIRRTLASIERLLVIHAVRSGSTWTQIGAALELSRQAAHARHCPGVNETDGDSPRPFV